MKSLLDTQMCAGQESGREVVIHTIQDFQGQEKTNLF